MMESMVFIFLGALLGAAGGAFYLCGSKPRLPLILVLFIGATAGIITAIALLGSELNGIVCVLMITTGFLLAYLVDDRRAED